MTRPRSNQFRAYFKALHDHDPFPWQRRLAARIVEEPRWPAMLDIPTGLGKTSAIDVALFVLAVRPEVAPRRIVLVVDRRVVVDQAADHARKIQRALHQAKEGVLHSVATALRELWNGDAGEPPFEVAVLRGGMPRDEGWAHRPDRPVVALSTVDQVGSRLLFRGYGVSAGMAPIHAGLLGHDALILLDEVQLSTAFAETLAALDERWRGWRERDNDGVRHTAVPNRWAFVRMSATPIGEPVPKDARFELDDEDLEHPIVDQRRSAHKHATLAKPIETVKSDAARSTAAVVAAFSDAAVAHLDEGARRIVVIVNRVHVAREVEKSLVARLEERADVALLTGRMRPLDRELVFGKVDDPESVAARVTAGPKRTPAHRPVVVVATQTIEAGADFDFDALVTECASIDALRQRFGRLDRRGESKVTRATILVRKDQATTSTDDPVYGAALAKTWAWLESKAGKHRIVDFGIAHFPELPKQRDELFARVEPAPVMLPAHLDALAQTNPRGDPDPDVALWLHGRERGLPEVRVVWRADIHEEDFEDEKKLSAYAAASLGVAPASSLEAISVPRPALQAWLEREPTEEETADVEGTAASEPGPPHEKASVRPVLVLERRHPRVARKMEDIPHESTIVVPAKYGGILRGNWDPNATDTVVDLGDRAQLLHRGRPVLRLVPEVLAHASAGTEDTGRSVPRAPKDDDPDFDPRRGVRDWIDEARANAALGWVAEIADAIANAAASRLKIVELGDSGYYAAVAPRERRKSEHDLTSDIVSDDDDGASFIGQAVTLEQHLGDVERWAHRFAMNLALDGALATDLSLAARVHDLGKADPRFQQMLHGGSPVRAAASEHLLAKSLAESQEAVARELARERSGYPSGYRHELLSVALLEAAPRLLERAHDRDLVLHLVASHHGWCRPFAPAVDHGPPLVVEWTFDGVVLRADAAHGLASASSGLADRYFTLTERYGWWTLAWLEAIVRLADHRASEEESEKSSGANEREIVRSRATKGER